MSAYRAPEPWAGAHASAAAAVSAAPEAADLTALAEADSTLLDGLREDRCESAARLLLQADFMLCATGRACLLAAA